MNFLFPLLGAGVAVGAILLFWSAMQNWLADFVHRLSAQFSEVAHVLQSALVILDRVVVTGQRLITTTLRTVFRPATATTSEEYVTVEEVRQYKREELPADILKKLDAGETLQYQLSVGSMKVTTPDAPTYRLVVRRSE